MIAVGLAAILASYLLGSVPFGVLVARGVAGVDPRKVGSGNIGASNVARSAGRAAGALTLLLDAGKAALPMLVASPLLAWAGASPAAAEAWRAAVGLAAFAGHLWPIWLRFHGGKGVATALGVFLVLAPMPALLGVAAFAIALAASRIPAVGSLAGVAVCTVGTLMIHGLRSPVAAAALVTALLVLWRHRGNIRRLARGTENRV